MLRHPNATETIANRPPPTLDPQLAELECPRRELRSTYQAYHEDLELITAAKVIDARFDPGSWSAPALQAAYDQLWMLCDGMVSDYGGVGIGRMYTSWYHLRRVRGAYELLRSRPRPTRPITVLDLGCGTGAVAWALGMLGRPVRYVGVDVSGSMLTWARGLWSSLQTELPECACVEVAWIQSDAIGALCDGRLADRADVVIMPFLLDDGFLNDLRSRGGEWRSCLEHMGVQAVLAWTNPTKLTLSRPVLREVMGSHGSPLCPPGWIGSDPACTMLNDARGELARQLGILLRDKYKVGVSISDTSGWCWALNVAERPRRSLSRVASQMHCSSADLIDACRACGFAESERFNLATSLSLGQLESLHRHLGRPFKIREYTR